MSNLEQLSGMFGRELDQREYGLMLQCVHEWTNDGIELGWQVIGLDHGTREQ